MRRNLRLIIPVLVLTITSCIKPLEDRLTGNWQLTESFRRGFFDRDYFQTGYESGIFSFHEGGSATYISNTDTLTGSWKVRRHSDNYYNSSSGQWESRQLKSLRITLINFSQNRFIDFFFDDFNFRNNSHRIRAEEFIPGGDKVYEFQKK